MNKFLVLMGIFLVLAGFFELSQGDTDWWMHSLQGLSLGLAGWSFERQAQG
jgi:hypothetical protein